MYLISRDELHVWYLRHGHLTLSSAPVSFRKTLSAEERARMIAFRYEADQRAFLLAHGLIRSALSRCATVAPEAWVFRSTPEGRPEIESPAGARRLRFSISHTRGVVACCVLLDEDAGIDVERVVVPPPMEVAPRCFSREEITDLERLPPEEKAARFFQYWTLKEAYVKATGTGLSAPLPEISFRILEPDGATVSIGGGGDPSGGSWWFHWRRLEPRHLLAVAVRSHGRSVRMIASDAGDFDQKRML